MTDTSIREITVIVTWPERYGHPLDEQFAGAENVELRAIRLSTTGGDGRYEQLVEIDGDLDRADGLLDDCSAVLEYEIMGTANYGLAYMQCGTNTLVEDLLTLQDDHDIMIDMPIHYLPHRHGHRWRLIGLPEEIGDFLDATPDCVSVELTRKRSFEPFETEHGGLLTDRQRELLVVAEQEGYYQIPRETTQGELASILNLAPGTVSEHLQRIEAKLAANYLKSSSIGAPPLAADWR